MKFLTPFIIVVLIITSAILGYGIYNQIVPRPSPSQQTTLTTPTQIPTKSSCDQFAPTKGEISCESAMNIALAKYPGKVFSTLPFDQLDTRLGPKNIWRIGVNLKNPVSVGGGKAYFSAIEVGIDRIDGKILFFTKAKR